MANAPEEDAPQGSEAEVGSKSGGGSMKMIIIGVALVVVLGGGGAGAWFFLLKGSAEPEKVAPKAEQKNVSGGGPVVSLEPFIVNLADPKGKRYLKVKLDLELSSNAADKELKTRMGIVRDQFIMALSSKTFQQIQGVPGKNVLRDELTARANAILKTGKVKKVYFTTFIVQ